MSGVSQGIQEEGDDEVHSDEADSHQHSSFEGLAESQAEDQTDEEEQYGHENWGAEPKDGVDDGHGLSPSPECGVEPGCEHRRCLPKRVDG